ncbi:unnamed protein product, partial [Ectocarpus sp. 12 AP-2014]
QVLTFCDNSIAAHGACCTDDEEAQVAADFSAVTPVGEELTGDCSDLYKQLVCGCYRRHVRENRSDIVSTTISMGGHRSLSWSLLPGLCVCCHSRTVLC